jgi:colanic acid/amylovoran biosynthesis protein
VTLNKFVEITGSYLANRGDALMLQAIVNRLASGYHLAVDSRQYEFDKTAKLGFYRKVPYHEKKMFGLIIEPILRWRKLANHGLVLDSQISAVLDAHGFVYGDPWIRDLLTRPWVETFSRWKRQNKKIIFLPQSFGPFKQRQVRTIVSQLLRMADLIFARDEMSYEYLTDLGLGSAHLQVVPDYTCGVPGICPNYFDGVSAVCIVPNNRMIDKVGLAMKKKYITFIHYCVQKVLEAELKPFMLLHEDHDLALAEDINARLEFPLPIVKEPDAVFCKGILGKCFAVISSRYHALVHAMNQGVPCLGTTWHHKYAGLAKDYNCSDCFLTDLESKDEITEKIGRLIKESVRSDIKSRFVFAAEQQKLKVETMWRTVEKVLN